MVRFPNFRGLWECTVSCLLYIAAGFDAGTEEAFEKDVEVDCLIDNHWSTYFHNVEILDCKSMCTS